MLPFKVKNYSHIKLGAVIPMLIGQLLFLQLPPHTHAAVVVQSEDETGDAITQDFQDMIPEAAQANPAALLPDTFRIDMGQENKESMNPLLRNFYLRLSRRDIEGALEALVDLQETQFLNPKLYTTQAQLHIFLKQYDKARVAARKAIRYDQSFMQAHKMLAFVNLLDGEVDTAIKDLLNALQYDENDTEVLKLAALGFLTKNDIPGATKIFAHIIRLAPKEASSYADFGNAWMRGGKPKTAILAFKKAVELDNTSAQIHNDLATAYVATGQLNLALDAYAAALEQDPFFAPAMSNMGILVFNSGQQETGLKLVTKACDTDIKSELSWNNLVLALSKAFPIAEHHLLDLPSDNMLALRFDRMYYMRAIQYTQVNRPNSAIAFMIRALKENPSDPEYMNDLGSLFAGTGAIEVAKVLFRRALHVLPGYVQAQQNLLGVEQQLDVLKKIQEEAAAKAKTEAATTATP